MFSIKRKLRLLSLVLIMYFLKSGLTAQIVDRAKISRKDTHAYESYVLDNITGQFLKNMNHPFGFDDFSGGTPESSTSAPPVYMSIITKENSYLDFQRNQLSYRMQNGNVITTLPVNKEIWFSVKEYPSIFCTPQNTRNERECISFKTAGICNFDVLAKYDKRKLLANCKVYSWPEKNLKLAVQVVHETNYNTTIAIDANSIQTALNEIYKQACLSFTVTKIPDNTVSFDKNNDRKLDINLWGNPELETIISSFKPKRFDYVLFL